MRAKQLRHHPLCKYCMARGWVMAATVVDHVVPHRGNSHLFFNGELQSLCASCHSSAKQQEDLRGYALEIGVDGVPVDPKHPANKNN